MKALTLILFILAACGGGNDSLHTQSFGDFDEFEEVLDIPVTKQEPPTSESSQFVQEPERKQQLKKNGSLNLKSNDLEQDFIKLQQVVKSFDAYIQDERQFDGGTERSYQIQIRVAATQFDSLVFEIAKIGKVENRSISVEDVTNRYYDLENRIANNKSLEARYRELLSKANQVKDILEIERNLNQVRMEIESLEGQYKQLRSQIADSSLSIYLYERSDTPRKGSFGERFGRAISNGWQLLQNLILGLVTLWPLIVFGALTLGGILFFRRKKQ